MLAIQTLGLPVRRDHRSLEDGNAVRFDRILKDNGTGDLGCRVLRKSEGDQRPEKTAWFGDGESIMLSV